MNNSEKQIVKIPPLTKEILNPQQLASLLASRICHDLISPVGALANAIELSQDVGLDKEILELVQLSSESASLKLQFCRLAFGASGNNNVALDLSGVKKIAEDFLKHENINFSWQAAAALSKNHAKLLANLLLIARNCLPFSGTIDIIVDRENQFTIKAKGENISDAKELIKMAQDNISNADINAHNINSYYTMVLARLCAAEITITTANNAISFEVK